MVPISSPARTISGTTPDVDNVIRRFETDRPSPSLTISMASRTLSKL